MLCGNEVDKDVRGNHYSGMEEIAVRGKVTTSLPGEIWFGSIYDSIQDMNDSFVFLKENNVSTIWNLLEDDTIAKVESKNFNVIHSPINDFSIPDNKESFIKDIEQIIDLLKNNKNIYVHCFGGHGRTGLAILCVKIMLGEDPTEALKEVKEKVSGPELQRQINFAFQILDNPS